MGFCQTITEKLLLVSQLAKSIDSIIILSKLLLLHNHLFQPSPCLNDIAPAHFGNIIYAIWSQEKESPAAQLFVVSIILL